MEIVLIPDGTVIWQLIIFLIAAAVLRTFVAKPALNLFKLRRMHTFAKREKAERANNEANRLIRERNELLEHTRASAALFLEKSLENARAESKQTIDDALMDSRQIIRDSDAKSSEASAVLYEGLVKRAKEYTSDIVKRCVQ